MPAFVILAQSRAGRAPRQDARLRLRHLAERERTEPRNQSGGNSVCASRTRGSTLSEIGENPTQAAQARELGARFRPGSTSGATTGRQSLEGWKTHERGAHTRDDALQHPSARSLRRSDLALKNRGEQLKNRV
jgi:hypothetical protein